MTETNIKFVELRCATGHLLQTFDGQRESARSYSSTMHEISIAQSIIEIAEAKAREQNSRCIQTIKIRLGEFTTVVPEALEFAFEVARQDTLAENARLEIESVPMILRCVACGPVTDPVREFCLICPQCGLPLEVVSGEELQVEYIEVDSVAERV